MTLKRRLVFSFIGVIAIGAGSSFLIVRLSTETLFRSFVFSGDADKAERYAALLGEYHERSGSWSGVGPYVATLPRFLFLLPPVAAPTAALGKLPDYADRVVLVDEAGVVIADSSGELLGTVHPKRHLAHGIPVVSSGAGIGTVLVGSMVDPSLKGTGERFLLSLTLSLLVSTLLAAVPAFLFALVFAARVTRPIVALNSAVKRVASGDLSVTVPESGDEEIAELSVSFNRMARELEALEEAKKRVIADAAHELRTPTTLIRGMLEGMIDGVFSPDRETLRSVHEETLRLSRLIDTLRELELIESGRMKLELHAVDVAETVARAAALFSAAAGERGIALSVIVGEPRPRPVLADTFRLDEVLYNLLANAVKYAGEGGHIRVSVLSADDPSFVLLRVDDSGPGIPAADRERVFERFYRTDASRSVDGGGRGLGLAIAREIVRAQGGTVSAGESDLGGASISVLLPAYEE